MKTREKPKYSIWQNLCFSVKLAWQTRKRVLLVCVVMAVIGVLLNLAELYIAPEILAKVEPHASLTELLLTIGGFTAALFLLNGLESYLDTSRKPAEIDVRKSIIRLIARKTCETSYAAFVNRREKAYLWANVADVLMALLRNGLAYALLIHQTLEKGLPASEFLLYFTAVSGFTSWVTGILSNFSQLHKESISLSRVQE